MISHLSEDDDRRERWGQIGTPYEAERNGNNSNEHTSE